MEKANLPKGWRLVGYNAPLSSPSQRRQSDPQLAPNASLTATATKVTQATSSTSSQPVPFAQSVSERDQQPSQSHQSPSPLPISDDAGATLLLVAPTPIKGSSQPLLDHEDSSSASSRVPPLLNLSSPSSTPLSTPTSKTKRLSPSLAQYTGMVKVDLRSSPASCAIDVKSSPPDSVDLLAASIGLSLSRSSSSPSSIPTLSPAPSPLTVPSPSNRSHSSSPMPVATPQSLDLEKGKTEVQDLVKKGQHPAIALQMASKIISADIEKSTTTADLKAVTTNFEQQSQEQFEATIKALAATWMTADKKKEESRRDLLQNVVWAKLQNIRDLSPNKLVAFLSFYRSLNFLRSKPHLLDQEIYSVWDLLRRALLRNPSAFSAEEVATLMNYLLSLPGRFAVAKLDSACTESRAVSAAAFFSELARRHLLTKTSPALVVELLQGTFLLSLQPTKVNSLVFDQLLPALIDRYACAPGSSLKEMTTLLKLHNPTPKRDVQFFLTFQSIALCFRICQEMLKRDDVRMTPADLEEFLVQMGQITQERIEVEDAPKQTQPGSYLEKPIHRELFIGFIRKVVQYQPSLLTDQSLLALLRLIGKLLRWRKAWIVPPKQQGDQTDLGPYTSYKIFMVYRDLLIATQGMSYGGRGKIKLDSLIVRVAEHLIKSPEDWKNCSISFFPLFYETVKLIKMRLDGEYWSCLRTAVAQTHCKFSASTSVKAMLETLSALFRDHRRQLGTCNHPWTYLTAEQTRQFIPACMEALAREPFSAQNIEKFSHLLCYLSANSSATLTSFKEGLAWYRKERPELREHLHALEQVGQKLAAVEQARVFISDCLHIAAREPFSAQSIEQFSHLLCYLNANHLEVTLFFFKEGVAWFRKEQPELREHLRALEQAEQSIAAVVDYIQTVVASRQMTPNRMTAEQIGQCVSLGMQGLARTDFSAHKMAKLSHLLCYLSASHLDVVLASFKEGLAWYRKERPELREHLHTLEQAGEHLDAIAASRSQASAVDKNGPKPSTAAPAKK